MPVPCTFTSVNYSKSHLVSRRTSSQPSDDSCAADARVHDWNHISEFCLESRVKICAALDGAQAIAVRQFCEDADVAAVLECST